MNALPPIVRHASEQVSDWLTYAEAAARFGVSAKAARKIAMRQNWPRRKPNGDPCGRVQVLIPPDAEIRPRRVAEHPSERPFCSSAEVGTLREQLARERERADALEGRLAGAEREAQQAIERACTAEQAAEALRRADQARAGAERVARITIQAEAAQLRQLRQADAARRSRGLLVRLRAAWRGE